MLTLTFSIILITWLDINQNKVCVVQELKKRDSNRPIKILSKVGFVFLSLFCFAAFFFPLSKIEEQTTTFNTLCFSVCLRYR